MYKYEVGQIIPALITRSEVIRFDIADDGATLIIGFPGAKQDELQNIRSGKFEMRFTVLYNVVMVTFKFGSMSWMDAPYNPHLSKNLTGLEIPKEGQGLGLTVFFVDTNTGELKVMRLLGLSERFTTSLFAAVIEEKGKTFDKLEYERNINQIFAKYRTNDIVKLSRNYYKIS